MGWVLEDDLHVSVILGVEVKLPRDFHSFGRHGSQVLSFAQFIMDHGDVMLRERERERGQRPTCCTSPHCAKYKPLFRQPTTVAEAQQTAPSVKACESGTLGHGAYFPTAEVHAAASRAVAVATKILHCQFCTASSPN